MSLDQFALSLNLGKFPTVPRTEFRFLRNFAAILLDNACTECIKALNFLEDLSKFRGKTVLTFGNDDSNEWYQDKINDKERTFLYTSKEIARIEGSELLTGN